MILTHTNVKLQIYQEAQQRWRRLMRMVIVITVIILSMIGSIGYYRHHNHMIQIRSLKTEAEQRQQYIKTVMIWKSAVEVHEAQLEKQNKNKRWVTDLYERLSDFQYVNLRLLRIRPGYVYCAIDGLSEESIKKYQSYMKKHQYKSIQHQQLDGVWFLEFSRNEQS